MAEAEHFSKPETGLDEPSRELARKGIAWTAAWQRRQGQAPPLLYHYTDAAGCQGIVQSRELWASNAAFLNDSSELVYIREVLGVVTDDLMARYEHRRVRQFLTLVEPAFSDFVIKGFDFFLACFCVVPDQLSQWRGYPSAGGGYSIGFHDPASPSPALRFSTAATGATRIVYGTALDATDRRDGSRELGRLPGWLWSQSTGDRQSSS